MSSGLCYKPLFVTYVICVILTMSHYVVSTVCSFIIGLHTMGDLRYYVIVDITLLLRMIYVL